MIQANGGNDTLFVGGSIISSTAGGGQGADYITDGHGATSILRFRDRRQPGR